MSKRKNQNTLNQDGQDIENESAKLQQIKQNSNLDNSVLYDQDSKSKDNNNYIKEQNKNVLDFITFQQNMNTEYFSLLKDSLRIIVGEWCNKYSYGYHDVALNFVDDAIYYLPNYNSQELLKKDDIASDIKDNYTKLTRLLYTLEENPPEGFVDIVGKKFCKASNDFLQGILDATLTSTVATSDNDNNIVLDDISLEYLLICGNTIASLYNIMATEVGLLGEQTFEQQCLSKKKIFEKEVEL